MAYHDKSFDADFELFGMTPRSNLGLEQVDGFSFDGADWNDPTGQDDLGSSAQDFAAFEVPSEPTYQMEVRNNQEGVFDVQKAHDVHTTSQYVPDVQPSLSMQQCQQPGLEGWRPFECTVQDFDEIVHRPSIVGNTHEGHGTGHNQSLSFQQMNRDLMEITSAVPTPQLYDHSNVARQRRYSAPWTPYTMPDTLYGTTPRVSPDTGAVFGSSIPVSNEQPLFSHGSSPVDQRVSMSYTRDPNGSESAKSYYGMSIDSMPVGHRRPSVSLSRKSSTRLSVGEAPLSPALTVTPDFVEACLTCRQDRCHETFTGEFRRGNLARHIRNKHGGRSYPCGVRGCDKKFQRSDARLKHQRKYHLELNLLNPVPRR